MRRVSCDQFEFDPPDSEQELELAIAAPSRRCPDLRSLLASCGASRVEGTAVPAGWSRWTEVAAHLRRFGGLELPHPSQLAATVLLEDDWNDIELGLAFGAVMVWYHWTTSA